MLASVKLDLTIRLRDLIQFNKPLTGHLRP